MTTVRGMLGRVKKLEVVRIPPVLAMFGGEEGLSAFNAEVAAGIAEGRYDPRDAPDVLASLMTWIVSPR